MSDYETFDQTGFSVRKLTKRVPRLSANYGGGYKDSALPQGSPYALRRWMLQCDALPNDADYMITPPDRVPQTRAEYFSDFWDRHQAEITGETVTAVNKPFIFRDPTNGRRYYASFVESEISLDVVTAMLFTVGIEIEMRRIRGVATFPDGSIDEPVIEGTPDDPAPENPDEV